LGNEQINNTTNKTSSGTTLFAAANILMLTTIASRILGYLRDVLIFAKFGQNNLTDAYNAAFSIPDFLYMILVGGALSSAFIPVFSSYLARNQEDEGWKVLSIIFNWIMLLLACGVIIGITFAPQLVELLVPGFDEGTKQMTVNLTRIMFFQVIFMCLSGISTGILQSYKNFTAPAVGSVLYNLGIILGGVLLSAPIEHYFPGYGIAGFSVGVVLGAMLNFLVQFIAILRLGVHYTFSFNLKHPGVHELLVLIVPVFIGLGASQFNLFVNQNLASGLSEGLVSALRAAQRLMQLPITLFGITVGIAFFPTMTQLAARNEIDEFKSTLMMGLRSVIFVTIPASVGLAALAEPVIRFMYEFKSGAFTSDDTKNTAYALIFYTIGVSAYSAIHTLSRAFYALKNTRTPVAVAVLSIVVNVILSIVLVRFMAQGGLALAYSIAGIFNMIVLIVLLNMSVGDIGSWALIKSILQTTLISGIMGVVVWLLAHFFELYISVSGKLAQMVEIIVAIGVGILVFAVLALLLKMPEAEQIMNILRRKFGRFGKRKAA
jgi:putative peptidoglycan lipid II flippase